jgi:hypothetical protein
MIQVVPAQFGWFAYGRAEQGGAEFLAPVALWALVDSSSGVRRVVGLTAHGLATTGKPWRWSNRVALCQATLSIGLCLLPEGPVPTTPLYLSGRRANLRIPPRTAARCTPHRPPGARGWPLAGAKAPGKGGVPPEAGKATSRATGGGEEGDARGRRRHPGREQRGNPQAGNRGTLRSDAGADGRSRRAQVRVPRRGGRRTANP